MGGAQKQDEMISAPPSPNLTSARGDGWTMAMSPLAAVAQHSRVTNGAAGSAQRSLVSSLLLYGLQGRGELRRRRRAWLCARISVDYSITALLFARHPLPHASRSPISGFLSVLHMRCACFLQTICTPLNITLADVVQPQARHDPRGKDSQTQKTPGTAASGACNLTRIKN